MPPLQALPSTMTKPAAPCHVVCASDNRVSYRPLYLGIAILSTISGSSCLVHATWMRRVQPPFTQQLPHTQPA
jgi:hypothetical protein